ncbi:hypothetical protein [Shewanella sp. UCD-KL21]|uniref:hypothetical protein n=1 Tax=Shewanella sp. UCD-KL21 TaxID=1917164 RepID=UPI00097060A2|nr:hypothetical protein [Shewanella sp. UCD-KL21]
MMKPDRMTAMQQLINQVKETFPLDDPALAVCGPDNSCIGCPKKLLEIVDSEVSYWQSSLDNNATPSFGDLDKFAKLCKNVHRGLTRNGVFDSQ